MNDIPPASLAPLFTWRSAIAESDLHPTTRHVLLTLSCYMNERGGSAYPGSTRLARDSGLNLSTVKEHLRRARDEGWLIVLARGGSTPDGGRKASEYVASVPGVEDPRSSLTGRPDRVDRSSSPRRPVVQDDPISSVITSEISHHVDDLGPISRAPWIVEGITREEWVDRGRAS